MVLSDFKQVAKMELLAIYSHATLVKSKQNLVKNILKRLFNFLLNGGYQGAPPPPGLDPLLMETPPSYALC